MTRLTANLIDGQHALELGPADRGRSWQGKHHQRCLPMMIANQAGWWIRNSVAFCATWNGGERREDLSIEPMDADEKPLATSHFGRGVVTFTLLWVFRTEPRWHLLLRGPSNWPMDGASPLEGVVETDWNPTTATMNWQITRPDCPVLFAAGMPFCQIMPVRKGDLEGFKLVQQPLADDAALHTSFWQWSGERDRFLRALQTPGSAAQAQGWQRDYYQGSPVTKLTLARLEDA